MRNLPLTPTINHHRHNPKQSSSTVVLVVLTRMRLSTPSTRSNPPSSNPSKKPKVHKYSNSNPSPLSRIPLKTRKVTSSRLPSLRKIESSPATPATLIAPPPAWHFLPTNRRVASDRPITRCTLSSYRLAPVCGGCTPATGGTVTGFPL